jgi:flagellar biosynthesis protein FlhG
MKVLSKDYGKRGFKLIVNNVTKASEGQEVYNRLSQVSDRFGLNIRINYLGHIFTDKAVSDAVRQQRLFTDIYPTSKASVCIHGIAKMLTETLSPSDIEWGRIFA